MSEQQYILIAGGISEPSLLAELSRHYAERGWQVSFSQSTQQDAIQDEVEKLSEHQPLHAFIYISPVPRQGGMLDDADSIIATTMQDDLEVGLWWVQAVCRKMRQQSIGGRIVTLAHIAALVPTEYFSYGASSQLALMNLCRSAILELAPYNININTVFRGFSAEDPAQVSFIEQLKVLHKDDGIPLLKYNQPVETAKTCYLLTDPEISSFNGAMLTLDGGFYVTRKIRYLSPTHPVE